MAIASELVLYIMLCLLTSYLQDKKRNCSELMSELMSELLSCFLAHEWLCNIDCSDKNTFDRVSFNVSVFSNFLTQLAMMGIKKKLTIQLTQLPSGPAAILCL